MKEKIKEMIEALGKSRVDIATTDTEVMSLNITAANVSYDEEEGYPRLCIGQEKGGKDIELRLETIDGESTVSSITGGDRGDDYVVEFKSAAIGEVTFTPSIF